MEFSREAVLRVWWRMLTLKIAASLQARLFGAAGPNAIRADSNLSGAAQKAKPHLKTSTFLEKFEVFPQPARRKQASKSGSQPSICFVLSSAMCRQYYVLT